MSNREKSIETLMDLRKRELDNLRRRMATLEDQRQQFVKKIIELKDELEKERNAASGSIDMMQFLNIYTRNNQHQQKQYDQAVKRVDTQIDELRNMILNAFSEQKKFEMALKIIRKRAEDKMNREERMLMDELGLRGYRHSEIQK